MTPPSLTDRFLYGLSLPERLTRGLSAVVGGLVQETSARLLPAAFRTSRSYDTFIQQSLDILTHDVGGVPRPEATISPDDVPLARKAVGGMLDFAGSATLHLSPITILAVINDLAYGSNIYLRQLADELREAGVIDESSTIGNVSDLLDVISATATTVGGVAEAPPLNPAAMRETVRQIAAKLETADPASIIPQHELHRMITDMQQIADASQVGLWQVGTAVGLQTMQKLDLVARGTLTSVSVAGDLLDQHLLEHYQTAITTIYQDGLFRTLQTASEPYRDAVWENLSPQRSTWTSDLLTGKWFSAT